MSFFNSSKIQNHNFSSKLHFFLKFLIFSKHWISFCSIIQHFRNKFHILMKKLKINSFNLAGFDTLFCVILAFLRFVKWHTKPDEVKPSVFLHRPVLFARKWNYSETSFNWRGFVWGVHFSEKVLNLFANPFFSILVKFITNILREQKDGFQWRRCSATLFSDNEFHGSRKWGLKMTLLIFSTAFGDANEQFLTARIKTRTPTHISKLWNGEMQRNNFPPIPGENTKYASCMLPQKRKTPPKALIQMGCELWFGTSFAHARTHKATLEQSRSSMELSKIKWQTSF